MNSDFNLLKEVTTLIEIPPPPEGEELKVET
jgi:hypothetical protein